MPETDDGNRQAETIWRLTERVKELTALHGTARIIEDDRQSPTELLRQVLLLLPPAWQYPEITEARLVLGDIVVVTPGWRETPWTQVSRYVVSSGEEGRVEVCYTEERPDETEGPFLDEERALIDSIAEMLHRWFQHRAADSALERIRTNLECLVAERTSALSNANAALKQEVAEHRAARAEIEQAQERLREMSNALCIAGERERRSIAQALHDHVGQSLAFVRMRLLDLQGNAIFCGFEDDLAHVLRLLDGTLRYTRDLTCELSPPRLYELGLDAALEWLAEQYRAQHKVNVTYEGCEDARDLDEEGRTVLYAAAREFLANAIRHGHATKIQVSLQVADGLVRLEVRDDGIGLDSESSATEVTPGRASRFGLFSIRERLRARKGAFQLTSSPGAGTAAIAEIPEKIEASS
jgi:signal transduction histidine kinase